MASTRPREPRNTAPSGSRGIYRGNHLVIAGVQLTGIDLAGATRYREGSSDPHMQAQTEKKHQHVPRFR